MVSPPSPSPTTTLSTRSWYFSPTLTMRGQSPAWWTVREMIVITKITFVTPKKHCSLDMRVLLMCVCICVCVRSETRPEEGAVLLLQEE